MKTQLLIDEAIQLEPAERARVVESLLASFHTGDAKDFTESHVRECEARIAAVERGDMAEVPAEEVFQGFGLDWP